MQYTYILGVLDPSFFNLGEKSGISATRNQKLFEPNREKVNIPRTDPQHFQYVGDINTTTYLNLRFVERGKADMKFKLLIHFS